MGRDPKDKYNLVGKLIETGDQMVFVFDLASPKITVRTEEDGKIMNSADAFYPAEWQNQFGPPVTEHDDQLMINIFDDKVVFNLEDDPLTPRQREPNEEAKPENEENAVKT